MTTAISKGTRVGRFRPVAYMSIGNCTVGNNWNHRNKPAQRKILDILVGKGSELEVY